MHNCLGNVSANHVIDIIDKTHNALDRCPTIPHVVKKMCIVGHLFKAMWDLSDRAI